jgi:hypothetical protein
MSRSAPPRSRLDSRRSTVRIREAAIGNLIADAMGVTGRTDAAIMNCGGIRVGRVYPPGATITRRDILAKLPFNNRVVTVEISGRDLKRALENGVAQLAIAGGRFPQISGITLEADLTRPSGSRIKRSRSAACRVRTAKCTGSRPTISLPAAATAMSRCAMPNGSCPMTTRRCSPIRSWSTCGRWERYEQVWRARIRLR